MNINESQYLSILTLYNKEKMIKDKLDKKVFRWGFFFFVIAFLFVIAFVIVQRGGDTQEQERLRREAEDMVYQAYLAKDYPRIIELVDSFKPLGSISEGKGCYWLGIVRSNAHATTSILPEP